MASLGAGPRQPGRGMRFFPAFTPGVSPLVSAVVVTPDVGVLTATGFAPSVQTPRLVTPGLGQLLLTGFAPAVQVGISAKPGLGQLILAGIAPTVATPRTVRPALGVLTLAGLAPAVTTGGPTLRTPGTGQLFVSGFATTVTGPPRALGGVRRPHARIVLEPRRRGPKELPRPTPKHRLELEEIEPPVWCAPGVARNRWTGYRPTVAVSDLALERLAMQLTLDDPDMELALTLMDVL